MLDLAMASCEQLFAIQSAALELPYPGVLPESAEPSKKAFGS
jgi:ribonuclease PH